MGYDDSNVSKLANLSVKEIDEFIERLRIFPGHRIKIFGLIDRISTLFKINNNNHIHNNLQNYTRSNFRSTGYNTAPPGQKRFHSTGQTRLKITNVKQLATIYGINRSTKQDNKKPKSVEPIKSKNRIIKNFLNNEGFGFNYYLKDKNEMTEDEYNQIVNRGISGQTSSSDNKGKSTF